MIRVSTKQWVQLLKLFKLKTAMTWWKTLQVFWLPEVGSESSFDLCCHAPNVISHLLPNREWYPVHVTLLRADNGKLVLSPNLCRLFKGQTLGFSGSRAWKNGNSRPGLLWEIKSLSVCPWKTGGQLCLGGWNGNSCWCSQASESWSLARRI